MAAGTHRSATAQSRLPFEAPQSAHLRLGRARRGSGLAAGARTPAEERMDAAAAVCADARMPTGRTWKLCEWCEAQAEAPAPPTPRRSDEELDGAWEEAFRAEEAVLVPRLERAIAHARARVEWKDER
jgi:hypothetical protein